MKKVIELLKKLEKLNNQMQENEKWGSEKWHNHGSIDDLIYECLTELGD